jgi:hypothetical protein
MPPHRPRSSLPLNQSRLALCSSIPGDDRENESFNLKTAVDFIAEFGLKQGYYLICAQQGI